MSEIMKKPNWIDKPSVYSPHPYITYFTGKQILDKFYNQLEGHCSLREDYIPIELKEKNWKPEGERLISVGGIVQIHLILLILDILFFCILRKSVIVINH